MTALQQLVGAFRGKKTAAKNTITSSVSHAMQEHESAVARLNRVICRRVHGRDCTCHEGKPLPGMLS